MYLSVSLSNRAYQNFILERRISNYARKARRNGTKGVGGEKGREGDVHIPIAYSLPICQELCFMDHWQRGVHIRKV